VKSLARPGGNITGLTSNPRTVVGKRLQLLIDAVGKSRSVGVLVNSASNPLQLSDMKAAARSAGVRLSVQEAREVSELEGAFAAMRRDEVAGVIELPDVMFYAQSRRIADLALRHRLPMMGPYRDFVDVGGLMAYGADLNDLMRRSATYVDKILKGSKPDDLPVEQAAKFELSINLKTAKALGLTIPPALWLQIDRVVE